MATRLRKAKYYSRIVKEAAEAAFAVMIEMYKPARTLSPSQIEVLGWELQCNQLKEELYYNVFKILHEADILAALDRSKVRLYMNQEEYDECDHGD